MPNNATSVGSDDVVARMVLYCLVCRKGASGTPEFLMVTKNGSPTFPPTKIRPRENLYHALVRPMQEDVGLSPDTSFPELELDMLPSDGTSHRYKGLPRRWHLYPVWISLTSEGWRRLDETENSGITWMPLDSILAEIKEPNVLAIASSLAARREEIAKMASVVPSMDALATGWSAAHDEGARVVREKDIRRVLSAGDRAFNLRVADPYLPYQKQGLGFTWSFFTPKDKQDVHVHGLPAVEIYGVMSGRLQLWFKPMNQRGVRTWQCQTLGPGDWAEVEPLNCHFACWLDREGLGTVVKASGAGPLAGVGRIGVAGKTACHWKDPSDPKKLVACPSFSCCKMPESLSRLFDEYQKEYDQRDYDRIAVIAQEAQDTESTEGKE